MHDSFYKQVEHSRQLLNMSSLSQEVKSQLEGILETVQVTMLSSVDRVPGYYIFAGNHGTGKHEAAKTLGQIFKAVGMLSQGHVVVCKPSDLRAPYVGQSAFKTRTVCKSALDGVLFIDEAYNLINTEPTCAGLWTCFNEEAYTEIISFTENNRHRICVIFAGCAKEMDAFTNAYPVLSSRVSRIIQFPDCNTAERFHVCEDQPPQRDTQARDENSKYPLLSQDISAENDFKVYKETFALAMKELDELVGLEAVKKQISLILHSVLIYKATGPGHYIFVGNPGTGKSEIAKRMGRIFKLMGILSKGHIVEACCKNLVSGFTGQTASKTMDICKEALDGVLFVDNVNELSRYDFDDEALATILRFMEDNRSRICVIFADYEKEMQNFFYTVSGIDMHISKVIHFPDYNTKELFQIFRLFANKDGFSLSEEFEMEVQKVIERCPNDGNAVDMQKLFWKCREHAAWRYIKTKDERRKYMLLPGDIPDVSSDDSYT